MPIGPIESNIPERMLQYQIIRIRLVAAICLLLGVSLFLFLTPAVKHGPALLLITAAYAVFAFTRFIKTEKNTNTNLGTGHFYLTIDLVVLPLLLIFGGKVTSPLIVIYFLLMLASGHRSNLNLFLVDSTTAFAGLGSVLMTSGYWHSQLHLGTGVFIGLLLEIFILYRHVENKTVSKTTNTATTVETEEATTRPQIGTSPKTLLITTDTGDRHMLLRDIHSWDIDISICDSAIRAFAKLIEANESGNGYKTILVDSIYLDMDPEQFALAIRSDSALYDICLVYISPSSEKEQEATLIDAGYTQVLYTPIDKTLLFDALHKRGPSSYQANNITHLINHYSKKDNAERPNDILLVVSDLIEQDRLRKTLEDNSQRVYAVSSGSQAMDALNTHQFDLVLIDFELPDIMGMEVVKMYHYTHITQDWTPFIAIVDEVTPELLKLCRQIEFDSVISRPIDLENLVLTVADITSSRKKQSESVFSQRDRILTNTHDNNSDDSQLLNLNTLSHLDRLSNGNHFLSELIEKFNEDLSQQIEHLDQAVKANKYHQFKDIAHTLRDSSCNIGAESIHKISLRALQFSPHDFTNLSADLLTELKESNLKTRHALHSYVIQSNNPAKEKE